MEEFTMSSPVSILAVVVLALYFGLLDFLMKTT